MVVVEVCKTDSQWTSAGSVIRRRLKRPVPVADPDGDGVGHGASIRDYQIDFPVAVEIRQGNRGGRIAIFILRSVPEFTVALTKKHLDLVIAQRDDKICHPIPVQIVDGNGYGCPVDRVLRPFREFAVAPAKQYSNLISARTGQHYIRRGICIEEACRQRPWFLTDVQLHLIVKAPIAVSDQDRQRVAAHIGRHEISHAILVDIDGGDGRGVLTSLVTREVVEEIRRNVGVLLGTRCAHYHRDDAGHEKRPAVSSGHWLPCPHAQASSVPQSSLNRQLLKGEVVYRRWVSPGNQMGR